MTKITRRAALGYLGVATLSLTAGCSMRPDSRIGGAVQVDSRGPALFGAYISPADHPIETPQNAAAAREFDRPLQINARFVAFDEPFPARAERDTHRSGQIPLVTWAPTGLRLGDIASGRYDVVLEQRARDSKVFGAPLLVRFAHEMNGTWYTWSSQHPSAARLGNTPAAYVAAWRHICRIFQAHNVRNVSWVWCPNAVDVPYDNDARLYYPGAAYVDWIGVDVYADDQAQRETHATQGFATLTEAAVARFDPDKPCIIAEFGFSGSAEFRAAQFRSVPTVVRDTPRIRALVYFDRDAYSPSSAPAVLAAARRMASAPALVGTAVEAAR